MKNIGKRIEELEKRMTTQRQIVRFIQNVGETAEEAMAKNGVTREDRGKVDLIIRRIVSVT